MSEVLDYDTLVQTSSDLLDTRADQLPARRTPGGGNTIVQAGGFGAELAAMAGPLISNGIARAPMSELMAEARRIGMQMGSRAYYSFPAGGARVEGGTIRLAEELSQLWGYLATAVQITDIRDSRVYLRGVAGDALTMRTHAEDRVYALSAPSGGFAKNAEQADRWQTMQIASGGSKALRSAIFRLIPERLRAEAIQAAREAKQPPANVDFQVLCDAMVAQYGKSKSKITLAELEEVAGVKRLQWKVAEWRALDDLMAALKNGETTVEEVWPNRKPVPVPLASIRAGASADLPEAPELNLAVQEGAK